MTTNNNFAERLGKAVTVTIENINTDTVNTLPYRSDVVKLYADTVSLLEPALMGKSGLYACIVKMDTSGVFNIYVKNDPDCGYEEDELKDFVAIDDGYVYDYVNAVVNKDKNTAELIIDRIIKYGDIETRKEAFKARKAAKAEAKAVAEPVKEEPKAEADTITAPEYRLTHGVGRNGMDFINLYVGKTQVAYAYQVQKNNSWDVKVKDLALMDKLQIEKAQFAGMAAEALIFFSKYNKVKAGLVAARKAKDGGKLAVWEAQKAKALTIAKERGYKAA